jgi:hypothetical protein
MDIRNGLMQLGVRRLSRLFLALGISNGMFLSFAHAAAIYEDTSTIYSIRKEDIILQVRGGIWSLDENLTCVAYGDKIASTKPVRYITVIRSVPITRAEANRRLPLFKAPPAVKVTEGTLESIEYIANGGGEQVDRNPFGYYEINVVFVGEVPNEFMVSIAYTGECETDNTTNIIYKPSQHTQEMQVYGHPVKWGPFTLRIQLGKEYRLVSKMLDGTDSDYIGNTTLNISGVDEVDLRVAKVSGISPLAPRAVGR